MKTMTSFDSINNLCNLTIYFGHLDDELYYVDSYFDNCYEESWFSRDLAKRIMKEIANQKPVSITINNSFSPQPDFTFFSVNDNKMYNTYEDFVLRVIKYCR